MSSLMTSWLNIFFFNKNTLINMHRQKQYIFLNDQYIFSFQDYFCFYQTLYKDDSQLCNEIIIYLL